MQLDSPDTGNDWLLHQYPADLVGRGFFPDARLASESTRFGHIYKALVSNDFLPRTGRDIRIHSHFPTCAVPAPELVQKRKAKDDSAGIIIAELNVAIIRMLLPAAAIQLFRNAATLAVNRSVERDSNASKWSFPDSRKLDEASRR